MFGFYKPNMTTLQSNLTWYQHIKDSVSLLNPKDLKCSIKLDSGPTSCLSRVRHEWKVTMQLYYQN